MKGPTGWVLWALLPAVLTACAPALPPLPLSPQGQTCRQVFTAVDRAVADEDCGNAAFYRIPGLPFLRTSRFWAHYAKQGPGEEELRFYLEQLRRFDAEARQGELACLSSAAVADLAPSRQELQQVLSGCGAALLEAHRQGDPHLLPYLERAKVPDDYRLSSRTLGLYPLLRIPFSLAVNSAYQERRRWYRMELSSFLAEGLWVATGPSNTLPPFSRQEVHQVLRESAANPLAIPLPSKKQARRLAEAFAPTVVQQTGGTADAWGEVGLSSGGVTIDGQRPTVYFYLDHVLWQGSPFLRLNYVLWHPERNAGQTPWYERGPLDGITFSLTLAADGRPFMAQTMNNCACYHQFFPAAAFPSSLRPTPLTPAALVPQRLPEARRLAIFLGSGWHQVLRLTPASEVGTEATYRLLPYQELERLPLPDGGHASLFDPKGIARGSQRIERFLFFSMGIPSVGSMRQRGHQPITLIGRQHYDDPELLEETFRLP